MLLLTVISVLKGFKYEPHDYLHRLCAVLDFKSQTDIKTYYTTTGTPHHMSITVQKQTSKM